MAVLLDGPTDGIIMQCNTLLKISEGMCGAEIVCINYTNCIYHQQKQFQCAIDPRSDTYVLHTIYPATEYVNGRQTVGRVAQSV